MKCKALSVRRFTVENLSIDSALLIAMQMKTKWHSGTIIRHLFRLLSNLGKTCRADKN